MSAVSAHFSRAREIEASYKASVDWRPLLAQLRVLGRLLCVHIGTFWPVRMSAAFPGPSDNLRTHDVLSDSLRLTWNAPASAVPVLGYQVSAQAGGTSGFSVVVVDTGSAATQAHVTGLHPGCWCVSLRAHPHAPARAPQVPGATWARCRVQTPLPPRCTSCEQVRVPRGREDRRRARRDERAQSARADGSQRRRGPLYSSILPLRPGSG